MHDGISPYSHGPGSVRAQRWCSAIALCKERPRRTAEVRSSGGRWSVGLGEARYRTTAIRSQMNGVSWSSSGEGNWAAPTKSRLSKLASRWAYTGAIRWGAAGQVVGRTAGRIRKRLRNSRSFAVEQPRRGGDHVARRRSWRDSRDHSWIQFARSHGYVAPGPVPGAGLHGVRGRHPQGVALHEVASLDDSSRIIQDSGGAVNRSGMRDNGMARLFESRSVKPPDGR